MNCDVKMMMIMKVIIFVVVLMIDSVVGVFVWLSLVVYALFSSSIIISLFILIINLLNFHYEILQFDHIKLLVN